MLDFIRNHKLAQVVVDWLFYVTAGILSLVIAYGCVSFGVRIMNQLYLLIGFPGKMFGFIAFFVLLTCSFYGFIHVVMHVGRRVLSKNYED